MVGQVCRGRPSVCYRKLLVGMVDTSHQVPRAERALRTAAVRLPWEGSTVPGQGINWEHSGQRKTSTDTQGVQKWPTLGLATQVLNIFTQAKGKLNLKVMPFIME